MGTQRTTFQKLQRERAKKAKQAAKRDKRQNRDDVEDTPEPLILDDTDPNSALSPQELLAAVESLHSRYDSGLIDFDQFEEEKADLMARIPVD